MRFHFGAAPVDGSQKSVLRTDEDRQVTVINSMVKMDRVALTANGASEPSTAHCVVVAVDACGVSAPILLNWLVNRELLLAEGAFCVVLYLLSVGN